MDMRILFESIRDRCLVANDRSLASMPWSHLPEVHRIDTASQCVNADRLPEGCDDAPRR